MNSFIKGDLNLARQVEPMEEVIDGLSLDVKQRHVRRLRKGKCTIELGFILSDVITNFERVSDHCSNIAVCLVQVNEDEFDTHAYLDELRQEDNLDFQGKVMACVKNTSYLLQSRIVLWKRMQNYLRSKDLQRYS